MNCEPDKRVLSSLDFGDGMDANSPYSNIGLTTKHTLLKARLKGLMHHDSAYRVRPHVARFFQA